MCLAEQERAFNPSGDLCHSMIRFCVLFCGTLLIFFRFLLGIASPGLRLLVSDNPSVSANFSFIYYFYTQSNHHAASMFSDGTVSTTCLLHSQKEMVFRTWWHHRVYVWVLLLFTEMCGDNKGVIVKYNGQK